jgi:hypothetical protein
MEYGIVVPDLLHLSICTLESRQAPSCDARLRLGIILQLRRSLLLPYSSRPNLSLGGNVWFSPRLHFRSMTTPLAHDLAVVLEGFDACFNNDLEKGRELCKFSGAEWCWTRLKRNAQFRLRSLRRSNYSDWGSHSFFKQLWA